MPWGENALSWEARARGVLLGCVAFLSVTGVATFVCRVPSAAVQVLQLAHTACGLIAIVAGGVYVAIHLRQTLGSVSSVTRRTPWPIRATVAVFVAATAVQLAGRLATAPRMAVGTIQAGAGAVLVLALLWRTASLLGGSLVDRSRSTLATGGVALLAALVCAAGGAGVATGMMLYARGAASPYAVHVASAGIALGAAIAHVAVSLRQRTRRRSPLARLYPWRRPLLTIAVPIASLLALATLAGVARVAPQPSSAAVDSRAIVPIDETFASIAPSACASCHADACEGWARSSHAHAASNPFFTALVTRTLAARGPEQARFCLGCHAPHAPDPSRAPLTEVLASDGFRAGVHCFSCHRSRPGPGHGDGSFSVVPLAGEPFAPLLERTGGVGERLRADLIAPHALVTPRIDLHRERFRFESREPVSCLPCHVQTLTIPTSGRLGEAIQDQYDSWASSPAAAAGVGCASCHAQRYTSRELYLVVDHRFLAASTYVASVAGGAEAVNDVVATLHGEMPLAPVLLEQGVPRRESGPLLAMDVEIARDPRSGAAPSLVVSTRGTGRIGHSFPNGPTDLLQVWLEAEVIDSQGRKLLDVGAAGPDGAPRLGHVFLDADGAEIHDHRLWAVALVRDRGRVPTSGVHQIRLDLPAADLALPLEVRAAWRYRRLDPELVAAVTGQPAPEIPIVSIAEVRRTIVAETSSGGRRTGSTSDRREGTMMVSSARLTP